MSRELDFGESQPCKLIRHLPGEDALELLPLELKKAEKRVINESIFRVAKFYSFKEACIP